MLDVGYQKQSAQSGEIALGYVLFINPPGKRLSYADRSPCAKRMGFCCDPPGMGTFFQVNVPDSPGRL